MLYVQFTHKSKYNTEQFRCVMDSNPTKGDTYNQTDVDVQEFYLMEKLYQVMRDDKRRGKRPSSEEFYLMEKLYHTMVNDKNRNNKLLKAGI